MTLIWQHNTLHNTVHSAYPILLYLLSLGDIRSRKERLKSALMITVQGSVFHTERNVLKALHDTVRNN